MASRTQTVLVDDFDDTEAAETVHFGLDGVSYEIDLNEVHAAELREYLGHFIAAGRRTGGRKRRGAVS